MVSGRGVAIGLVRLYQRFISPMFGPCCRFVPTCSQYAVEAFEKYGVIKGFCLSLWRLVRCGPWHPGGYDPVP